jgi:hypothetical protein
VGSAITHGVPGDAGVVADQALIRWLLSATLVGLVALMVLSSDTGMMGGDVARGWLWLAGRAVTGVINWGGRPT